MSYLSVFMLPIKALYFIKHVLFLLNSNEIRHKWLENHFIFVIIVFFYNYFSHIKSVNYLNDTQYGIHGTFTLRPYTFNFVKFSIILSINTRKRGECV